MKIRSYTELRRIDTFEDRFEYLKLNGIVGRSTFGFDRHMNQQFYTSREWRHVRDAVIARDIGMDLGCEGYEIHRKIAIHHMNPMTVDDVKSGNASILDPEFLITTTLRTHNAIHYGDKKLLIQPMVERKRGDTQLWGPIQRR